MFRSSPKTEILETELYMYPEKDRSLSRPRDTVRFSAFTCPEVLPGQKFKLALWASCDQERA